MYDSLTTKQREIVFDKSGKFVVRACPGSGKTYCVSARLARLVNSWDRNYQIFTRYLSRDDFKLLSDFFNNCKAAQAELEQWRRYFVVAREEKGKAIQAELVKMASEFTNEEDYSQKKDKIVKKTHGEDFLFNFGKPEKYFAQYVQSIHQVSGTTALASLNKLSKKK